MASKGAKKGKRGKKDARKQVRPCNLENPVTALNKEVRPFFLVDNSIWSFRSVSSLSDYSIWRS